MRRGPRTRPSARSTRATILGQVDPRSSRATRRDRARRTAARARAIGADRRADRRRAIARLDPRPSGARGGTGGARRSNARSPASAAPRRARSRARPRELGTSFRRRRRARRARATLGRRVALASRRPASPRALPTPLARASAHRATPFLPLLTPPRVAHTQAAVEIDPARDAGRREPGFRGCPPRPRATERGPGPGRAPGAPRAPASAAERAAAAKLNFRVLSGFTREQRAPRADQRLQEDEEERVGFPSPGPTGTSPRRGTCKSDARRWPPSPRTAPGLLLRTAGTTPRAPPAPPRREPPAPPRDPPPTAARRRRRPREGAAAQNQNQRGSSGAAADAAAAHAPERDDDAGVVPRVRAPHL